MAEQKRPEMTLLATAIIAVGMAWSAGFVDAVSYLDLHRIYTSHMTGNTASIASNTLKGDWREAMRYAWTLICFMAGLLVSAGMTLAERRQGIRSALAAALGIEVALLVLYILLGQYGSAPEAVLIFLPAASMGIQTVTVTRVGSVRVYTTYVTGSLSQFSEAVSEWIFWFRDRTKGRLCARIMRVLRVTPRQEPARRAAVTGSLWVAFFTGAVCGAAGERIWKLNALAAPVVLLAVLIGVDLSWPAALGEKFRGARKATRGRRNLAPGDHPWPDRGH